MVTRPPSWKRHLPTALLLAGAALLLVGAARPRATITVSKQDATVLLVLDVSGSMAANDSSPTRLGAARAVAERYIDTLPHGYRIGVITFSDHAAVVAEPTTNVAAVRAALAAARTGREGTALSPAVARAVALAKSVSPKSGGTRPPASLVVLSDGGQNTGKLTPAQAGADAKKAEIPVTAVAIGTPDGVVEQPVQGGYTERIQVPVEPSSLQTIANASGGKFYSGVDGVDVRATYHELGSRVGHKRKTVEVTAIAAGGGLAFMLVGGILGAAWFRRLV